MTVRLVNAGHDDVAYNLVQFTVENSAEESGMINAYEDNPSNMINITIRHDLSFFNIEKKALENNQLKELLAHLFLVKSPVLFIL